MDSMRAIDRGDDDHAYVDDCAVEPPPAIGTDERRMHVRAYNYWVSLLHGRAYPSIEDLDPASIDDFGPHSVLLDFTGGIDNPAIAWLGRSLREECDLGHEIRTIAEVPSRSLLSRLTDHFLQIIANRAPIGFEAEFVSTRGRNTMYRGILMPFSSDAESIDFIYGVINWKEVVEDGIATGLAGEFDRAIRQAPRPIVPAAVPVWADGPNAQPLIGEPIDYDFGDPEDDLPGEDAGLHDWLAIARDSAEAALHSDGRSRAALYAALGRAYDFALVAEDHPDDYAEILADAGLTAQARAPMTPIVKLVFGIGYDKTRLTEYAAALAHGLRKRVPAGGLVALLDAQAGGLKGVVKAERLLRAPAIRPDRTEIAREKLRALSARASIAIDSDGAEFVLLVARRAADGSLSVLAPVSGDAVLVDRAVRSVAA